MPSTPASDGNASSRIWGAATTLLAHWPYLCLFGVGVLLMVPTLIWPGALSDSVHHNLVWATQFRQSWRTGEIYPRWLPDGFDGLGSAAFYFYGPVPFFVVGMVDVMTGGLLATERILSVSGLFTLIASGIAMRLWLARVIVHPALQTLGAIMYMAAPYHLLDYFIRGAVGEFTAYALLPLVALGIASLANGGAGSVLLVGGAFAGLVLSHLPTALIVATFGIPALLTLTAADLGSRAAIVRFLAKALTGGGLALLLSAVYWLPALTLLDHVASQNLWGSHFAAANWVLLTPWRWPGVGIMVLIVPISISYTWIFANLFWILRQHASRIRVGILVAFTGGVLASIWGLIPWIWEPSSMLSRVQFPWRALVVVEFLLITALVSALDGGMARAMLRALRIGGVLLVPAFALLSFHAIQFGRASDNKGWREMRTMLEARLPDAAEYLPHGFPITYRHPASSFYRDLLAVTGMLAQRPFAWAVPESAAEITAEPLPGGGAVLDIDARQPADIVLRRFYFPMWRLDTAAGVAGPELRPFGTERLLSFSLPAGVTRLVLRAMEPPVVTWGRRLTMVGLILAALLAAMAWRHARRLGAASPSA